MRTNRRKNRLIVAACVAASSAGLLNSVWAANQTWDSLTTNPSWSPAANWSAGPLANGDALFFGPAATTSLFNDLIGSTYRSLNFNADAPAYVINGNPIHLGYLMTGIGITAAGDIVSNAVTDQTVNLPLSLDIGKHSFTTGANALNLHGAITRVTGANAFFTTGAGSINVTGSGLTTSNGILGGWATTPNSFATLDGSNNVVPYTAYAGANDIAGNGTLPNDSTANVRITTSANQTLTALPATVTSVNSLLFTTSSTTAGTATIPVGAGNTLSITSGGIYNASITPTNTGTRNLTIGTNVLTGGRITAGDGVNPGNLQLSSNSATAAQLTAGVITINSSVTDNGASPVSVTVAGGYVTLANANSYTGGTYILSGRVSQPTAVTFGTGPIYIFAGGEINPGANFPITFTNNVFIAGNGTPETGGLGALRMFQNTNGQNTQITGTVTLMETASICSNGLTQAQADASRNVGISGKITGPGGLTIGSPITTGGTNGVGIVTVGALYGSFFQNDYAGDTTITGSANGATGGAGLRIGAPSDDNIMPHGLTGSYAGGTTGDVVMNATSGTKTATFDLNGSTQTINGLISTAASPGSNTVFSSLPNGVLILGDSNVTATFAGNIQDGSTTGASLGITKIGSGMQTFSGNLNYSGPTVVTGGTLAIGASSNLNSSKFIDVQSGATLDVSASGTITVGANQILGGRGTVVGNVSMSDPNAKLAPGQVGVVGTLTVNGAVSLGGGTFHVDQNTPGTLVGNDLLQVNGNLTLGGTTTLQVERPASGLANGSYPLIRYTGTLTNGGNFALTPSTRPNLSVSFTGGAVDLIVGGSPSLSLTWSGNNGNNNWELVNTPNFNSGGQQFFNWDSVTFSDSGNNASDVNVSATLEPTAVTLTNTIAHPYTFSGGGNLINTTLNKTGNGVATLNIGGANRFNSVTVSSGTLVLQSGNNLIAGGTVSSGGGIMVTGQGTFSGFTVNSGGQIFLGDGVSGAQGDLRGTLINNGTVTFNRPDDFDASISLAGNGTLRKQGNGQVQMDVASPNFTGTVELASGKARLNANSWELLGSTGGGTVIISSGAQLSLGGMPIANLGGISENAGGGFGTKLFKIAGTGPDGSGAIFNDGQSQATAFQRVTLTNNATIGANSRIDIRSGNVGGVNLGTLDLAGNTLTKIGGQVLGLANVNVTDGNIVVNDGTLQIEGSTNIASLSAGKTITVAATKGINFLQTTGTLTRPIVLSGDGTLQSLNNALANATATVGSPISLGGNLTLSQATTTANGNSTLVLNGPISESPAGSGRSVTKTNNAANVLSTVILGGNNTYTGGTTVSMGTLITNTNFSNGTLAIAASATARVAQRASSNATSGVTIVPSLDASGTFDLTNNALVWNYTPPDASPIDTIRGKLVSGYANGAWTGTGINSSTAAGFNAIATNVNKRALGYAEASSIGKTSFFGNPVDNTAVLVAYTISGDANLDSRVNALDFNALASNFGAGSNVHWFTGDFNYDGTINTLDFNVLATNFNQVLPTLPPAPALGSLVPEPTSWLFLSVAGMISTRRGRRRPRPITP